ncbi:MAG: transporter substrate-binding domain-containing protein [Magnetovibrio sp.]|nr:transporter substrate-binding domain-containing protein [Magnetovibrio sp.]
MHDTFTTLFFQRKITPTLHFALTLFLLPFITIETVSAQKPEVIELITYHTHPPFMTQAGAGLTYDLAQYLNTKSSGKFVFKVRPMSRPRVNMLIAKTQTHVVPWVNPAWFKDSGMAKYLWTQNALMEDTNAVISRASDAVEYTGPEAFNGRIFGGIHNHLYTLLDDYINKTHMVKRVDADRHTSNIRKLAKGRIDVTIMPSSAALYLITQEDLAEILYISPRPHSTYSRKMLITKNRSDIQFFLDQAIIDMASDPHWQNILNRYN